MVLFDELNDSKARSSGKVLQLLFLSLMTLLLAFFILLQTISTFEKQKYDQVVKSVVQHFKIDPVKEFDHFPIASYEGDKLSFPKQILELGNLFETEFHIIKAEFLADGEKMLIEIDARDLFHEETGKLYQKKTPVLDKVAAALSQRYPQGYYKLDFYILYDPSSVDEDEKMKMIQEAGLLALYLRSKNLPAYQIGIGLEPGEKNVVRFVFHRESPILKKINEQ